MLSKKERVTTRHFTEVLTTGKTVFHPLFSVRVLQNKDKIFKLAAVVPKAVAKKAVKRNELRRVVYNFALQNKAFFKKDCSYIVFLKKGTEKMSHKELFSEMNRFFKV